MIVSKNKLSLFDIAELHLSNTKQSFKLTDILDVAIHIRAFLDKHPFHSEQALSGKDRSPQLQYYYRRKARMV